jgi:hypothetical protein
MARITIVDGDSGDWVGIYKDGKLLDQGHSFEPGEVLDLLGIPYNEVRVPIPRGGHLPDDQDELES